MPVSVDLQKCVGSRDCLKACAFNALDVIDNKCVIYENCVDCDECVRACPTHAIISSTAAATSTRSLLVVDFSERSGIMAPVERAAKRAGISSASLRVDASDASVAADALASLVSDDEYRFVALPHLGAGPAIAARLAAKLEASLLAGCEGIAFDDDASLRATRLRFGGLVRVSSRVPAGRTVITFVPRGPAIFAAQLLATDPLPKQSPRAEIIAEAPQVPERDARVIVSVAGDAPDEIRAVAQRIASSLGAVLTSAAAIARSAYSPELYVAVGVEGSTEHNAAVRGAGTIVAIVAESGAPITQIADFTLTGDVAQNAAALASAVA